MYRSAPTKAYPQYLRNESANLVPRGLSNSCSIDALCDIYYYVLFLSSSDIRDETQGILGKLNEFCRTRTTKSPDELHLLRDIVWDFMVLTHESYRPKGTIDAEFVQSLFLWYDTNEMTRLKFCLKKQEESICQCCGTPNTLDKLFGPVMTVGQYSGTKDSVQSLSSLLTMTIQSEVQKTRQCCGKKLLVKTKVLQFPKFLMLEMPINNGKNTSHFTITDEVVNVSDTNYIIAGLVMTRPEHFYSIVRIKNEYWVMDGLKSKPHKITLPVIHNDAVHVVFLRRVDVEDRHEDVHWMYDQVKSKREGEHILHSKKQTVKTATQTPKASSEYPSKNTKRSDKPQNLASTTNTTPPNPITSVKTPNSGDNIAGDRTGKMTIGDAKIAYLVRSDTLFLQTSDVFHATGLSQIIEKRGYAKAVDSVISEGYTVQEPSLIGVKQEDHFLYQRRGRVRNFISCQALLYLLNKKKTNSSQKNDQMHVFRDRLIESLSKETVLNVHIRKRYIATPEQKNLNSSISPAHTPMAKSFKKKEEKGARRRLLSDTDGGMTRKLHHYLLQIEENLFANDHDAFVETLSKLIGDKTEDFFKLEDMDMIMQNVRITVPGCVKKNEPLIRRYERNMKENLKLSPDELVNVERNLSGYRLGRHLRGRLPGLIPSEGQEASFKKKLKKEFEAVLLPIATTSGLSLDTSRVLQLFDFRYPLIPAKDYKIYGDGFEMGGRKTAFIGISILNDEAALYGMKYQSPKSIFPVSIFYGSDDRGNLESNLVDGRLADCITKTNDLSTFYLAADEMCLEAFLDGENKLSPTSDDGFDLYHMCNRASKGLTDPETGYRTTLNTPIDRDHPTALLPIPTSRVIMCVLHGEVRVCEKFLDLVVEHLTSERNKVNERGMDGTGWFEEAVSRLEQNLSKRNVKQSTFVIHYNAKGDPEPIKLNGSDAEAILTTRPGVFPSSKYPHPFQNVLSTSKIVEMKNPEVVQRLHLKPRYTEFELMKEILVQFKAMLTIIEDVPAPTAEEIESNQVQPSRHDDAQIKEYTHAAECFYQLFINMFGAQRLTPYMIKFVDHVPELMRVSQYRLGRFSTQSGEKKNYDFSMKYYTRSCRGGGAQYVRPFRTLLEDNYITMRYAIMNSTSEEKKQEFERFLSMHVAAVNIQRRVRGEQARRKLSTLGWSGINTYMSLPDEEKSIIKGNIVELYGSKAPHLLPAEKIFTRMGFIIVGAVQKMPGFKDRNQLIELIKKNGGRIYQHSALMTKCKTKKYIILTNQSLLDKKGWKSPRAIREAVKRECKLISFRFIDDCLKRDARLDQKQYLLDMSALRRLVLSRYASCRKKNMMREPRFITKIKQMKRKQKIQRRKHMPSCKPGRNAKVDYALRKRSEILRHRKDQGQRVSLPFTVSLLKVLYNEWDMMDGEQQEKYTDEWRKRKSNWDNLRRK